MPAINIEATDRSPFVDFNFDTGNFVLRGESYPEDTARFFGPLYQAMREYLEEESSTPMVFDLALQYFNSSSAKALMNLFQLLETAAENGRDVTVNWHYAEDDDTMLEFGEDFAQDFHGCTFNLCADADA